MIALSCFREASILVEERRMTAYARLCELAVGACERARVVLARRRDLCETFRAHSELILEIEELRRNLRVERRVVAGLRARHPRPFDDRLGDFERAVVIEKQ